MEITLRFVKSLPPIVDPTEESLVNDYVGVAISYVIWDKGVLSEASQENILDHIKEDMAENDVDDIDPQYVFDLVKEAVDRLFTDEENKNILRCLEEQTIVDVKQSAISKDYATYWVEIS